MTGAFAFWDASALVPLCVRQQTTQAARAQQRRFEPTVWWATIVEARSALARLRRSELVSSEEWSEGLVRLSVLAENWSEIAPSQDVRTLAGELLGTYALRAADSLQLAAALIWCRQRSRQRPFVCADQRLAQAAESAGFTVIALS